MKDSKVTFSFFSITQWKQEQDYLGWQHKNGWRFTKVHFPGIYYFEKCEPEDVVYQLDYNPHGIAHKAEYVQLFKDCGWEYLQDFVGYSYFRKPAASMAGDEEIFCDDASRIDFMKRVFTGRLLPLLMILMCLIIPQIAAWTPRYYDNEPSAGIILGIFAGLGIFYLLIFLMFAAQYLKYSKSLRA